MILHGVFDLLHVLIHPHSTGVEVLLIEPVAGGDVHLQPVQPPLAQRLLLGELERCFHMQERGLGELELYSGYKLAGYVSKHLRQGIEAAVPAAAEAMRYLRSIAGTAPKDQLLRWVSPAGFPVVQFYAHQDCTRIYLDGVGVALTMSTFDPTKVDRAKAVNGVSPNFVHSLDSAHLVRTIGKFSGSIIPIHDSFATHPADVDEMHSTLRDEFASMYSEQDPIDSLLLHSPVDTDLPRPTRGSLDINKVRESVFFMC